MAFAVPGRTQETREDQGGYAMNIRINAGYIITDSVHVGEMEFVLGVHSIAAQQEFHHRHGSSGSFCGAWAGSWLFALSLRQNSNSWVPRSSRSFVAVSKSS